MISLIAGMRSLCRNEKRELKRELKVLVDDFGLLKRKDVQEMIKTARVMRIYTDVYLK